MQQTRVAMAFAAMVLVLVLVDPVAAAAGAPSSSPHLLPAFARIFETQQNDAPSSAAAAMASSSASSLSSSSFHTILLGASYQCPDQACVAINGDCTYSANTSYICPITQYKNESECLNCFTGCQCRYLSAFPALGTPCDGSLSPYVNECGPTYTRVCGTHNTASGVNRTYNCYSKKKMGDRCTSAFDCLLPRVCGTAGVCTSNLASGARCYDRGTGLPLGQCPITHYCKVNSSLSATLEVCTVRTPLGGECNFEVDLDDHTICAGALECDSQTLRCGPIAAGQRATGVIVRHSYECASSVMNRTDNRCLDFASSLATFNSLYANRSCVDRSSSGDLNECGAGSCECGRAATGNSQRCVFGIPPPSLTGPSYVGQIAAITAASNAGCETESFPNIQEINDQNYCTVRSGAWQTILRAQCLYASFQAQLTQQACDPLQLLCAGMTGLTSGSTTGTTTGTGSSLGAAGASAYASPLITITLAALATIGLVA